MIQIFIPNNNINERKYIIDIIFNEFLGLEYKVKSRRKNEEDDSWIIELENKNKLIFEDHFFNKFPEDLEYLKLENIPNKIGFTENDFIVENDAPIIYGGHKLETISHKQKTIICGLDIFASSFFMLTRWEEYVNKNRDVYNRFPAYESLAFKNNFLDRPIVNEYVEMLWNMLAHLGINQKRKTKEYQLYLTHDVDVPLRYTDWKSCLPEICGDILKRKDPILAIKKIIEKLLVHLGLQKDPFDTFDYLMDISEKVGVKSYFFFMGEGVTSFDNAYQSSNIFIKKLVKNIKNRGHEIGIHPTFNAYNDSDQFKKEKEELEKEFKTSIAFGREHFLRFEVPVTWQIWEDNDMKWDSTLGYADKVGFRCGVCFEYSVFNILTRKKLRLKERPLIVMEASFLTYSPEYEAIKMEEKITKLMKVVKKYNGEFVFIWHNSSFNVNRWKEHQYIYEKVLTK